MNTCRLVGALTPFTLTISPTTSSIKKGIPQINRVRCTLKSDCFEAFNQAKRRKLFAVPVCLTVTCLFADPAVAAQSQETEVIRYQKLNNGVKFEDIVEGEGPVAYEGALVELNYVCRRSNGYFVHSTIDQFSGESNPVVLPLDKGEIIEGLKDVLVGMKVGGKRRALIPPSVGYVNERLKPIPNEFGPRRSLLSHAKEPLIFEVQLLKVLS